MSEFFHMGGYGQYVWSAYGLSLVVLILNVVSAHRQMVHMRKKLVHAVEDPS